MTTTKAVSPARRMHDEIMHWLPLLGTSAREVPVSPESLAWFESLADEDQIKVRRWIRRMSFEYGFLFPLIPVAAG